MEFCGEGGGIWWLGLSNGGVDQGKTEEGGEENREKSHGIISAEIIRELRGAVRGRLILPEKSLLYLNCLVGWDTFGGDDSLYTLTLSEIGFSIVVSSICARR